jgi:hypothetical protein
VQAASAGFLAATVSDFFYPLGSRQQDSGHVSSAVDAAIAVNDALEYPF